MATFSSWVFLALYWLERRSRMETRSAISLFRAGLLSGSAWFGSMARTVCLERDGSVSKHRVGRIDHTAEWEIPLLRQIYWTARETEGSWGSVPVCTHLML